MPPWHPEEGTTLHAARDVDGHPIVIVDASSSGFTFRYADGTMLWLDRRGTQLWCTWPAESTLDDAATYLIGPALAFLLRLRGALALHASGVAVDDVAVAFVGPHAAGKSTVAAAFGRRGFPLLTDDVLRLTRDDGCWSVEPFGGILRLWPESELIVLQSHGTLPRITPTWDKLALTIGERGTKPALDRVRLGAVVFLDPREPGEVAPRLVALRPAETVLRLAINSSASHLLDTARRAEEFVAIDTLVREVPAVVAIARDDVGSFDAFVDEVLNWVRAHKRAA